MDNRSIFLYRSADVISEGGTQEGRHRPRLEMGVQTGRGIVQANPHDRYLREVMGRPQGRKRTDPTLPIKASS